MLDVVKSLKNDFFEKIFSLKKAKITQKCILFCIF